MADSGSVPLPPEGGRGVGERVRKERLRSRAKQMRGAQTPAEHRLWQMLRGKRLAGYKFKRQVPIDHYIVDFACLSERVVVEADGGQHQESARDAKRDAYLNAHGFRVLRFWNNDFFNDEEGVLLTIRKALEHPSPQPLSRIRGEGLAGAPHG